MKMMKSAVLLMAMTLATVLTGCKSDNNGESTFTVNNNETTVNINRLGGSVEIPISASGTWTAEVPEDQNGNVWAAPEVGSGTGNGKLLLMVDYFDPNEQLQERTANLVVKSGDKTQTIKIRQYIGLRDGETASNDETTPYYDLWFNKGLGCGLNPLTGKMTSPVLNIYGIKKAMHDGGSDFASLLRQTVNPNAANDVIQLDTLEDNEVGLRAQCSIEVSYLTFKLKIGVEYGDTARQMVNVKNYQAQQKLVFLESSVDNMTIQGLLEDDPEFKKGETKNMFTIGFRNIYKKINAAGNAAKRAPYIKKLIDGYGPVYVTDAELGGNLFVAMRFDSIWVNNSFAVGGNLDLALTLGPVNIDVGVDVKYSREGTDIWSNSHHYATCAGGDQQAIAKLAELTNQSKPNPDLVKTVASQWAHSIVCSDNENDNTALIKITCVPIWELFPEDIAEEIKDYTKKIYEGKTLGINLKDMY